MTFSELQREREEHEREVDEAFRFLRYLIDETGDGYPGIASSIRLLNDYNGDIQRLGCKPFSGQAIHAAVARVHAYYRR